VSTSDLILVVEDDGAIRQGIVDALAFDGFESREAATGRAAFEQLKSPDYSLVLLDLTLPGADGLEILDHARQLYPNLPVIIITARGGEEDRVKGLKKGADDYIVKPFSVRELLARVEAVLRRARIQNPMATLDEVPLGNGRLHVQRSCLVNPEGQDIKLSDKELAVLKYFLSHPKRNISRDELLERVWRMRSQKVETRSVDMTVSRLREKLQKLYIQEAPLLTIRGLGYRYEGEGA
jgi:DNA-binding response OmpR family regulator